MKLDAGGDPERLERLTLGGEYALRFAHIDDDSRDMTFNDAGGSFTFVAAPRTKVFGRGGVSTMFDRLAQERHTGPYFGMGIEYAAEHATVGARFDRQFLPSFGFGGSNQTQELGAYVRAPLARRVYSNGSFTWRHAIPFLASSIEADTYWLRGSLGYRAARWMNVEGFYLFGRHDPIEVGGDVTRHRIGVQVVLMQPMRIQ